MATQDLVIGFQEEWAAFRDRHELFTERFPRLMETMKLVFERNFDAEEPIDRFVNLYGRMCMEEFFEILVMCGNGYGFGALKILRGMWEKAVTLEYIEGHPDELDNFLDYHFVSDRKLFRSVRDVLGEDALPAHIIAENEAAYERVKDRFIVPNCKECGTTRVNFSWNRLDIVSMSKQTRLLGKIVNEGYYIPMAHTHSTATSFVMRLEERDSGALGFNPDAQRSIADTALRTAHLIALELFEVQRRHYNLTDLAPNIEQCEQDWRDIYRRSS